MSADPINEFDALTGSTATPKVGLMNRGDTFEDGCSTANDLLGRSGSDQASIVKIRVSEHEHSMHYCR